MKILSNYTRDELIMEAETLEEYDDYLHMELIGYTVAELKTAAALQESN